jgi:protein subunit release factor A
MDLSALPRVMDGEIDRLIDALIMEDEAERLATLTGGDDGE